MLNFFMARLPVFADAFVTLLIRKVLLFVERKFIPPDLKSKKKTASRLRIGLIFLENEWFTNLKTLWAVENPINKWLLEKRFLGILVVVYSYSYFSY